MRRPSKQKFIVTLFESIPQSLIFFRLKVSVKEMNKRAYKQVSSFDCSTSANCPSISFCEMVDMKILDVSLAGSVLKCRISR